MKLGLRQLRSVTLGAARINKIGEQMRFNRFTADEEALYIERDLSRGSAFHERSLCTAGIKLWFKTNSPTMKLEAETELRSSRRFFAFDVFVNGRYTDSLSNFIESAVPAGYTAAQMPFELGRFEKEFELGKGEKTVAVYFPALVGVKDFSLTLKDGATLAPVRPSKRLLVYGDSITQGYDALHPSRRYAARLADALDAEEINKAIGGEVFFPGLAEAKSEFSPDYITVAYGTNDWFTTDGATFIASARAFFAALCEQHPKANIFAITPIYRKDMNLSKPFGAFLQAAEWLKEIAADFPGVTVIDGMKLVPHDHTLYADLRLHPSDAGYDHYAKNLIRAVKAALKG